MYCPVPWVLVGWVLFTYWPFVVIGSPVYKYCMTVAAAAAAAKSLQSCLTLCDPIDGSPPGSTVPGILQARTLEWVAISFSNAWKWEVKVKSLSPVQLFVTPWAINANSDPRWSSQHVCRSRATAERCPALSWPQRCSSFIHGPNRPWCSLMHHCPGSFHLAGCLLFLLGDFQWHSCWQTVCRTWLLFLSSPRFLSPKSNLSLPFFPPKLSVV